MRQFLRAIMILGLSAVMAFTLVSCGDSGGSSDDVDEDSGPAILSIDVTPKNFTLALSGFQQFTATGKFADGTTKDVSADVYWGTTNSDVATQSNTVGSKGLVAGKTMGTTTVTATDPDTGISGSTGLNHGCTASVASAGATARTNATVTLALSCSSEAMSTSCTTSAARI